MLSAIFTVGLFILLGIGLDFIITLHYRFVAEGKAYPAAISTTIYLILSFVIMKQLIQADEDCLKTIAYAIGAGIGSFLAVRIKKSKK